MIKLAAITGISFIINPYTNHKATPRQNKENMPSDKSFAERVFHVLITCGKNAAVVKQPATNPKICIPFILITSDALQNKHFYTTSEPCKKVYLTYIRMDIIFISMKSFPMTKSRFLNFNSFTSFANGLINSLDHPQVF